MSKSKTNRKVNKNIFFSRLHLYGFTEDTLGASLNPPVRKHRISQILKDGGPDYRLREIAAILKTNVQTIFPKE